jgi:hypothetical protein
MSQCMVYGMEAKQNGLCSNGSARRGGVKPVEAAGAGARGREVVPAAPRRYERFEPVTVRAAARVLQLQRSGVIPATDAGFYLRELAAMDAHAGENAFESLLRAARRQEAVGQVFHRPISEDAALCVAG